MIWAFLNSPSSFDGDDAEQLRALADDLRRDGRADAADRLDAITARVAPLTGWYGEATNQAAHVLIGIVAAVLIVAGWFLVTGELPWRSAVLGAIAAAYWSVERAQGWQPGDSWFDAAMVIGGACLVLLPFHEVALDPLHIAYSPSKQIGIVTVLAVALALRVARRTTDAKEHHK